MPAASSAPTGREGASEWVGPTGGEGVSNWVGPKYFLVEDSCFNLGLALLQS